MNNTFCIITEACSNRKSDSYKVRQLFIESGYHEIYSIERARYVVYLTCGAYTHACEKALAQVENIQKKLGKEAQLIVGGCLPKTNEKSLAKIFSGIVISPDNFNSLIELLNQPIDILNLKNEITYDRYFIPQNILVHGIYRLFSEIIRRIDKLLLDDNNFPSYKTLYIGAVWLFLKSLKRKYFPKAYELLVARGCSRKCSYCAIRFAVGQVRSIPIEKIIYKIKNAINENITQFDLVADSLGDYGFDIGTDLGALFENVLIFKRTIKLGLREIDPLMFIRFFKAIEGLCQTGMLYMILVPLQSGSTDILTKMHRLYNITAFKEMTIQLKRKYKIKLYTHIIIGFPSETADNFQETILLLKEIGFDGVWAHVYGDMPNTESSKMAGKISSSEKKQRIKKILKTKGIKIMNKQVLNEELRKN